MKKEFTDKQRVKAVFIAIGSLFAMNGLLANGQTQFVAKEAKQQAQMLAEELEKELEALTGGLES